MSIEMHYIFKNIGLLPKICEVAQKPIFDIIRADRPKNPKPPKSLKQERQRIQQKLRQTNWPAAKAEDHAH